MHDILKIYILVPSTLPSVGYGNGSCLGRTQGLQIGGAQVGNFCDKKKKKASPVFGNLSRKIL